jgi:hypothetical protein
MAADVWIPSLKWALNPERKTPTNVLGGLSARMTVRSANSTFWHVTRLPGCGRGCAQAIEANKVSKPASSFSCYSHVQLPMLPQLAETQELSESWHFLSLVTRAPHRAYLAPDAP